MTVKFEDFLYPSSAGLGNHEEGELLKDAVIPLLVSLAKIAPGHGLPDSEVIDLTGMGFQSDDKIPKALPIRKLSEHHRKQLIPTSITLYILVTGILPNYAQELKIVKKAD